MYLDANDSQTNHFWPSFRSGFPKNGVYKGTKSFFVTHSVFLHRRRFVTYTPISARRSFSLLTHSHSSWIYCYCYYYTSIIMPSVRNAQALPSIDPSIQPNYYRTILPNLSYPYCPNSHMLCSGSSAPLLFSVSQTFFLHVL